MLEKKTESFVKAQVLQCLFLVLVIADLDFGGHWCLIHPAGGVLHGAAAPDIASSTITIPSLTRSTTPVSSNSREKDSVATEMPQTLSKTVDKDITSKSN